MYSNNSSSIRCHRSLCTLRIRCDRRARVRVEAAGPLLGPLLDPGPVSVSASVVVEVEVVEEVVVGGEQVKEEVGVVVRPFGSRVV